VVHSRWVPVVGLLLAVCWSAPMSAAPLLELKGVMIGDPLPDAQRAATLHAVQLFYSFWNTGDTALLDAALSSQFIDRTLPPGRPQGPQGPAFASRNFRAAVPDLSVSVEKVIVAGRYVTVHMQFSGHFTGTFNAVQGHGAAVHFIATDLLEIEHGRIVSNWHIEDNLTLLTQMGLVK
jgi:predicted ester cyclase